MEKAQFSHENPDSNLGTVVNQLASLELSGRGLPVSGEVIPAPVSVCGEVTPPPVPVTKEWHQSISSDLRTHLVKKLVHAVNTTGMQGERLREVVAFARKVEEDMFEMANSRAEYYHLLAVKAYQFLKEAGDVNLERRE